MFAVHLYQNDEKLSSTKYKTYQAAVKGAKSLSIASLGWLLVPRGITETVRIENLSTGELEPF